MDDVGDDDYEVMIPTSHLNWITHGFYIVDGTGIIDSIIILPIPDTTLLSYINYSESTFNKLKNVRILVMCYSMKELIQHVLIENDVYFQSVNGNITPNDYDLYVCEGNLSIELELID
ncbi:hypothetical protein JTB14_013952 [Gonioctena quinquepunctata]|nr:hypothetical protein JTB14_013952 [Gonioctena quinquepunctata]